MESKYKVWCKNEKDWEKDICVMDTNGMLWQNYRGRLIPISQENHIALPYTGVKDINKKESYLGDILKDPISKYSKERVKKSFGIVKKENNSNNLYIEWNYVKIFEGEECWLTNNLPITHIDKYEVVGNIFKNPDMIRK